MSRLMVVRVLAAMAAVVLLLGRPAAAQQTEPPRPPEAGAGPGAVVPDPRPGEAFADPAVAALQRTATDVQKELADLSGLVRAAEADLRAATRDAEAATAERVAADEVVAGRQGEVDRFTAALLAVQSRPGGLQVLLTAGGPADFLQGSAMVERMRADTDGTFTAAVRRQDDARAAERTATDAQDAAARRKAELDRRTDDASNRAAAVSSEMRGRIADTDAAVIAAQKAQRERNERTAANWRAYTDRLAAAGIRPPPGSALRDPARLPPSLRALPGQDGPQPGVAEAVLPGGERLLVLPAETVAAVDAAVGALGRPYVPDKGEGPLAYSCDGLVKAVFKDVPGGIGEQYARIAPVPAADAQPGDLVFVGPARLGVQSVGVVLDGRTMLAADARLAGVVVTDLPGADSVVGFARPALGQRAARPAPAAEPGGLTWRCGSVRLPPRGPGEAAGAWGGYPNGLIPQAALCRIGVGTHALRCDAAAAYQAMSQAFAGAFGGPLCITDSYRTFAAQVRLYGAKPALAAVPGTSNHGWGMAVDLCGGAQSFGSPQYRWLAANAGAFGWSNPAWAQPGRGREEPWHWEYTG
ncbi:D-alanyl-D-alanine carboxypeptidase family protein [Actinokineospora guangxiensis]|uniref:D-alanyl-D-alanine carboxypeptidase family protein n=1 Tax=Actinokineospora guangxiensis TaxID=1490288 RepID=A0ABW0EMY6_9PSEU